MPVLYNVNLRTEIKADCGNVCNTQPYFGMLFTYYPFLGGDVSPPPCYLTPAYRYL